MSVRGTTESVSQATVDVGSTFATVGERGLLIYALLLVIFMLLLFLFFCMVVVMRSFEKQARANEKVADALNGVNVQLSRVESAIGVQQIKRGIERGEIPRGMIE